MAVEALGCTLSTEADVICCNFLLRSGILVIPRQEERTSRQLTSVMPVNLHYCFFFFKSDITDSVAVILS